GLHPSGPRRGPHPRQPVRPLRRRSPPRPGRHPGADEARHQRRGLGGPRARPRVPLPVRRGLVQPAPRPRPRRPRRDRPDRPAPPRSSGGGPESGSGRGAERRPEHLGDRHPGGGGCPRRGPLRQDRGRHLHRRQPGDHDPCPRQDRPDRRRRHPRSGAGPPASRLQRLLPGRAPLRDLGDDPRRRQRAGPDRQRHGHAGRRRPRHPRGRHLHPAPPRRGGRYPLRGRPPARCLRQASPLSGHLHVRPDRRFHVGGGDRGGLHPVAGGAGV
ncbi:MAG: 5-carboxymethyl-2-hydroxymuconate delta-isomerase, partial [uncultured Thermomicrobiales bacterium]